MAKIFSTFLRAPGNYDPDAASTDSGTPGGGRQVTREEDAKAADINFIVAQFGLTGELPFSRRQPLPDGDYDAVDYREALDFVRAADASFASLPAAVRQQHDNDPARFIAWVDQATPEELLKYLPAKAGADQAAPVAPAPSPPSGTTPSA